MSVTKVPENSFISELTPTLKLPEIFTLVVSTRPPLPESGHQKRLIRACLIF